MRRGVTRGPPSAEWEEERPRRYHSPPTANQRRRPAAVLPITRLAVQLCPVAACRGRRRSWRRARGDGGPALGGSWPDAVALPLVLMAGGRGPSGSLTPSPNSSIRTNHVQWRPPCHGGQARGR